MVNGGGGQQDPIVERLIRLELELKAGNQRTEARFEALTQHFETQMAASNQRVTDAINAMAEANRTMAEANRETNQRVTDAINTMAEANRETNQRVNDAVNMLLEANRETNQRVNDAVNMLLEAIREASRETNQRVTDAVNMLLEANRETNERITETARETNRRIDGTNARLDNQGTELRREFRSDSNRLVYMVLGIGGAIIASVLVTHFF